MQHKNKIMIGVLSLLVILAIVLTVKFKIAVKDNNIVEGTVSSASKSTEDKLSKAEYTQKGSDISEDMTSSASKKEKDSSDLSTNTNYNKNSQGENGEDTTSSASMKEEVSSSSNMNSKNINRYTNSKSKSINIKDDAVSSASKGDEKNKSNITNKNHGSKEESKNNIGNLNKEKNVKGDAVSSASKKEDKNTNHSSKDTTSQMNNGTFIDTAINKDATKLVDLGWVKYIVVTFNEGTIEDYNLYVLDGNNYKSISPSKVDDNGKIVKWEIDKLGYNTIKVISKKSGKEGIYKFAK